MAGPCCWYNRSIGSITHPSANSIRTNSPESILMWRLEHKKFRRNLLYPQIYSGGCVAGSESFSSPRLRGGLGFLFFCLAINIHISFHPIYLIMGIV